MRGFKDIIPPLSYKFEFVKKIFEKISHKYAVDLIELPLVEQAELYIRTSGEESEICNKELFEVRKYKGEFENWVLRPEGTASCVRAIKEANYLEEKKICRLGYYAPMFRYNRPQKGRYRQFNQAGFEWLGLNDKFVDLELILSACDLLDALKINYTLELNSIGNLEDRANYRKILKEHFKIEEDPFKILDKLDEFKEIPKMEMNSKDLEIFEFICSKLTEKNISYKKNPYLVRGLDYYNGIVFEFKHEGQTVLAGGRYDGLMQQLGGKSVPAIGFAMGVDRVVDILNIENDNNLDVAIISLNENEYGYSIAEKLRNLNFRVHPFWGLDLKKGLKIATKICKYVVIVGENEKQQNKLVIRNLDISQQKEVSINFSENDILNW